MVTVLYKDLQLWLWFYKLQFSNYSLIAGQYTENWLMKFEMLKTYSRGYDLWIAV